MKKTKKIFLTSLMACSFFIAFSSNSENFNTSYKEFDGIDNTRPYSTRPIIKNIQTYNYEGDKKILSLSLNDGVLKKRDVRLIRVVEGNDVFTFPEFSYNMEKRKNEMEQEIGDISINIDYPKNGKVTYQYNTKSRKNAARVKKYINSAIEEEADKIAKKYFHFTDSPIGSLFDYKYVSNNQSYIAKELSQKINNINMGSNKTPKNKIDNYLNFVQQIPYDQSKMKEKYFRTPFALMMDNRGDCDEKALLLSMILKETFHNLETGIIILPYMNISHAVSYIEYPWESNHTISINGKNYLLLETTAKLPAGIVPNEILQQVKNNNIYKIEI